MLTISLDTLQSLLAGIGTAAWAVLAFVAKWFHNRLKRLEDGKAGAADVARVSAEVAQVREELSAEITSLASDVEVVKRVLFLVAHTLKIPAEALNR